jgi:hypothetical protein
MSFLSAISKMRISARNSSQIFLISAVAVAMKAARYSSSSLMPMAAGRRDDRESGGQDAACPKKRTVDQGDL